MTTGTENRGTDRVRPIPEFDGVHDIWPRGDSMVKEKTLASPSSRDPRWRQIIPSSECAPWKRQWPVVPTYSHGGLDYGTIVAPDRTPA